MNGYENAFDVSAWKYRGIHIWPIIKTICFIKWFYEYNTKAQKKSFSVSLVQKLRLLLDTMISLFYLYFSFKKKTHIFSTGGEWQNALDEKGKSVNRFLHPIFKEFDSENHVYAQYSDKRSFTPPNVKFLKLLSLVRIFRFKSGFSRVHLSESLAKNTQYVSFLDDITRKSKIDFKEILPDSLESNLSEFFAYQKVYRLLLRRLSPRVCMFSGYDKIQNYALIYEAKKLNIPTVDVQHGLTGKLHLGYSQFLNRPYGGYNTLPSIFWSWDEESKKVIESWSRDTSDIRVIIGGNPWLSFMSKQMLNVQLPVGKKVILVTLQHNGLPEMFYEAIKNSPEKYFWILRIHPRFATIKTELESKLQQQIDTDQVLIHNAVDISLPPLLKKIDVHLTQFSSTVLEASFLGVPSVVIDPVGVTSYQYLIDQGVVMSYLGTDHKSLIVTIEKLLNTKIGHDFVDVKKGVIRLEHAISQQTKIMMDAV